MPDGTHRIDITVLEANETNPFIVDYIALNRISGGSSSVVGTSHNIPSSTSTSSSLPTATSNLPVATRGATPVGVIVGSVLGGITGIILAIALGFCLGSRNKPGGLWAYYFNGSRPTEIPAGEGLYTFRRPCCRGRRLFTQALLGHIEPYNATATASAPPPAGFSGPDPQPPFFDESSNRPFNLPFRQSIISSSQPQYTQSGPTESGPAYVSSNTAQPNTGKAALIAQRHQGMQQSVQRDDSRVRLNEDGEREAGPSRSANVVPPSYTSH
jgi:hypothetical protein